MALGCNGSRWLRAAASPFASMPPKPAGSWKAKALAHKAAAKAVLARLRWPLRRRWQSARLLDERLQLL